MELTVHTGSQGASTLLHVDWFDENMKHQITDVEIRVKEQDKPRVLQIVVADEVVAEITGNQLLLMPPKTIDTRITRKADPRHAQPL